MWVGALAGLESGDSRAGVVGSAREWLGNGVAEMASVTRSPPHGPAVPPSRGVEPWRARFVLSAQNVAPPKVVLVGSGAPQDAAVESMAADASAALASGLAPELVDDGLGVSRPPPVIKAWPRTLPLLLPPPRRISA